MLDYLYLVEFTFEANVCIYQLVESDEEDGKTTAELVRPSLCHYPETFYVNIHEKYVYRCRKCGDSLWKDAWLLHRHERTGEVGVPHVYPGGVYHPTPVRTFE